MLIYFKLSKVTYYYLCLTGFNFVNLIIKSLPYHIIRDEKTSTAPLKFIKKPSSVEVSEGNTAEISAIVEGSLKLKTFI